MRKSLTTLLIPIILFCFTWTTALSEGTLFIQLPFDEVFEFVAPYEGIGIEAMTNIVDGTIPYRGSGSIISEKGEYTAGRIGDYYGPVKVMWKTSDYFPPLPKGLIIGMSKNEVVSLLSLDTENNRSDAILENTTAIEQIILFAKGIFKNTSLCITVCLFFENDALQCVELTNRENKLDEAQCNNTNEPLSIEWIEPYN